MLAITSAIATLALVVQPLPSDGVTKRLRVIAETEARTIGLPSLFKRGRQNEGRG